MPTILVLTTTCATSSLAFFLRGLGLGLLLRICFGVMDRAAAGAAATANLRRDPPPETGMLLQLYSRASMFQNWLSTSYEHTHARFRKRDTETSHIWNFTRFVCLLYSGCYEHLLDHAHWDTSCQLLLLDINGEPKKKHKTARCASVERSKKYNPNL